MPPAASALINALNHPLRRRILFAYLDGSVEAASARELAAAMDARVGQVAYHLRTLARGDILRPVPSPAGEESVGSPYGWTLAVEPQWLRLVLEVWAEFDTSR